MVFFRDAHFYVKKIWMDEMEYDLKKIYEINEILEEEMHAFESKKNKPAEKIQAVGFLKKAIEMKKALEEKVLEINEIQKDFLDYTQKLSKLMKKYVEEDFLCSMASALKCMNEEARQKTYDNFSADVSEKLKAMVSKDSSKYDVDDVIEILNKSGCSVKSIIGNFPKTSILLPSEEKNILMNEIKNENPLIHSILAENLLSFEDLLFFDDYSIKSLLHEIDTVELAVAMKGIDDEIAQKIFRVMSQRSAEMLKEEMEFMGPVRTSDIEKAQQKIMIKMQKLVDDGDVVLVSDISEFIGTYKKSGTLKIGHLLYISDDDLKKIFSDIDINNLAKAVKSIPKNVSEKIFSSLDEDMRDKLYDITNEMGPVRINESNDCVEEILERAKSLLDKGEISMNESAV